MVMPMHIILKFNNIIGYKKSEILSVKLTNSF
jgi:hypothetical protein